MNLKILVKQPRTSSDAETGVSTSRMPRAEVLDPGKARAVPAKSSHTGVSYDQQVFECNQSCCIIGRTKSDLVLSEVRCSRQHALLYENHEGELHLKDLDSTNGTFLNEEKVTEGIVKAGDEIRIGKTILFILDFLPAHQVLRADGAAASPTEDSQEPTQTKTGVLISGPEKIFKAMPPQVQEQFIDYVDEEGTKARVDLKDLLKRGGGEGA